MAYSFLVFDFGGNEEVAQQARHKIDGWKQGFRLDKKLQVRFDRQEPGAKQGTTAETAKKPGKDPSKAKDKSSAKAKSSDDSSQKSGPNSERLSEIRLIVRLDFSDHEKLSHHRWLERIPVEEPFKTAKSKIIRLGDPDFSTTSELFDSLDRGHSVPRQD